MQARAISRRGLMAAAAASVAGPGLSAERPAVLRVGNQKGGLRSLLEASGAAKELPYALEWAELPAAAPLLEALNAGALDIGYQGDLAFLTSFAAGAPLRAIGAGRSSAAAQAILVKQDSPIRAVADLQGRKVAGNRGGWGQYLIRSALQQAGVACPRPPSASPCCRPPMRRSPSGPARWTPGRCGSLMFPWKCCGSAPACWWTEAG